VQRRPAAVPTAGEVRRHDVRVELRLSGPTHPVAVGGGREPARPELDPAAAAAAHATRLALEVAERRAHGLLVRPDQCPGGVAVADREQHTDALGRRERQVQCAHPIPSRPRSQCLAALRVAAGDQRRKRVGFDLALEAESCRAGSRPSARRLPAAGVVVVAALRHLLFVVALLPRHQLADRQRRRLARSMTASRPPHRSSEAPRPDGTHRGATV